MVSLPFSDYGGPLFKETEAEVAVMQEVFATNAARLGCIEIRGEASLPVRCQRKEHFKRHWLELSLGLAEVRKRLDKRTIQYSINKALRNGVAVREDNTREGLLEFMRLNELTRRKHGVPCQPARFFEGILEHMIGPGHGFVLLAQHGSANIAGGLFLTCGDTMYYKFNASDPVALSKLCPNHLLTWHAIEKGVAEGYRCLDFGRTATANEGLIRYKEMWGAKAEPIPYYYYPRAEGASAHEEDGPRHLLMLAAWRMLPQSAARRVSERIYGYFG